MLRCVTDPINNSFLIFVFFFCQKLLVGLKADLKNDEDTIEALAKRNLVREGVKLISHGQADCKG